VEFRWVPHLKPKQYSNMKKIIILLAVAIVSAALTARANDAEATNKTQKSSMKDNSSTMVSVRYMIDDVDAAIKFYTTYLGFTLQSHPAPPLATVTRGNLRLLLSGPESSGRRPLKDGTKPEPGGWNRIELQVADIQAEAARLGAAGVKFRRDDIVTGPGGSQIWIVDPSGNLVELFQPGK
jgi:catechol 2,3-dioxygenase-like lactoylglutathione lyase family enzyme